MTKIPTAPKGYNTVNPFVITNNADTIINFVKEVFGAEETEYSRTLDDDGLILHCEMKIGNSVVMFADRKPDWAQTPSLLQVYVDDINSVLEKAVSLNAEVITKPTEFLGALFSRVKDSEGNLWWIYQYLNKPEEWDTAQDEQSWEPSQEAMYIHDTLVSAMQNLKK